jgi:hypothetical protein
LLRPALKASGSLSLRSRLRHRRRLIGTANDGTHGSTEALARALHAYGNSPGMVEANGDPHRAGEQMDVAGLGTTEPLRARGLAMQCEADWTSGRGK